MTAITLSAMEALLAKQFNFYEAPVVTAAGDADGKSFTAASLLRYGDGDLTGKWYRISQTVNAVTTTKTGQVKDNIDGKVMIHDPFGAIIGTTATVVLYPHNPDRLDDCINDAIVLLFPELSKLYDSKTVTVPDTATRYISVPTGIRRVITVSRSPSTTDNGDWYPEDFDIVESASGSPAVTGPHISFIRDISAGTLLRIIGIGILGAYTSSVASTVDIPEEWVTTVVYQAIVQMYLRMKGSVSSMDSKEIDGILKIFTQQVTLMKTLKATSGANVRDKMQFDQYEGSEYD